MNPPLISTAPDTTDRYPTRDAGSGRRIDRPDPVVWGDRPRELSPEQLADYDRQGYLILEQAIDAATRERISAEFARLSAEPPAGDPRWIFEAGTGAVRSIFDVDLLSPALTEVLAGSGLPEIARGVLDDEVSVHQSRINAKPGFGAAGFYWHSDFETWHAEDGMPVPRALSFSIALTDNTTYNGPLTIIPGSHRHFVPCRGTTPPHYHEQSLLTGRKQIGTPADEDVADLYRQYGIDVLTCRAGDVVMFDSNCLHASAENLSPLGRRNVFVVYNAVSNRLRDRPYAAPEPRPPHLARRENPTRRGA